MKKIFIFLVMLILSITTVSASIFSDDQQVFVIKRGSITTSNGTGGPEVDPVWTAAKVNYFTKALYWANATSSFLRINDQRYNESLRINSLNNTKLDKIDQRYNSTLRINSLNNTKLDKTDQRYNETNKINSVNLSLNNNYYTKNNSNIRYIKNENSLYLNIIGTATDRNITFNETKLNATIDNKLKTITYNVSTVQTVKGTNTTSNLSLLKVADLRTYNISEVSGTTPLDFRMNFTGVTSLTSIKMREQYTDGSGHYLNVQLWDYATSSWETYYTINQQLQLTLNNVVILDPNNHISGGKVQLRFNHSSNSGNPAHRFYIDFVWLQSGVTTSSSTDLSNYPTKAQVNNNFTSYWNYTQTNNQIVNSNNSIKRYINNNFTFYFTKLLYWSNLTSTLANYLKIVPYQSSAAGWSNTTTKTTTTLLANLTSNVYLPNTKCSASQVLTTSTTTGLVSCTTPASGSFNASNYDNKSQDYLHDVRTIPIIYDELTYWTTARTNGIGICAALSSGTAVVVAPKNQQIGRVSFLDSATANGGYRCATDTANLMYFTGNERFVVRFDLPNTANVLNTTIKAGFSDATTVADAADGCYFKSLNRNLQGRCANNSVYANTATNLTLVSNENYIGELQVNSIKTLVTFKVYNFTSCSNMSQVYKNIFNSCTVKWTSTVNSKIPQIAARAFGIVIDATQSSINAGAILVNWDYFYADRK